MARIHVHEVDFETVGWDMTTSAPRFRPALERPDGTLRYCHAGATDLDPYPGYVHERVAVQRMVRHVQRCFRPDWDRP